MAIVSRVSYITKVSNESMSVTRHIIIRTASLNGPVHFPFNLIITMSDWDEPKTVIGFKRQVAKVAKKDSDLNGPLNSFPTCAPY